MPTPLDSQPDLHAYQITDFNPEDLTTAFILRHSMDVSAMARIHDFAPTEVSVGRVMFRQAAYLQTPHSVEVRYEEKTLTLHCTCTMPKRKMCEHQRHILNMIMGR